MVFEFAMWAILMGGTWYMKRWKARNAEHDPTLSSAEEIEVSGAELESQVVRSDAEKSDGKVGITRLV